VVGELRVRVAGATEDAVAATVWERLCGAQLGLGWGPGSGKRCKSFDVASQLSSFQGLPS